MNEDIGKPGQYYLDYLHRLSILSQDDYDLSSNEDAFSLTKDGIPIRKLFIGNIAQRTTHKDLEKIFSKYGKLDGCYLKRNVSKNKYAFVTFNNVEDALRAREDGYNKLIHLHNRDLRVMPADSWHQPDSIENIKKNSFKKKEKETDDSSNLETSYVTDDTIPIHRLNDDCLIHIFHYLPIVDRVKIESVCQRWRAVCQEAWRGFRTLDLSQTTWGFTIKNKKKYVDTPTLRKVLLRCGRFLNHIDFSQPLHRLSQSTLTIVSKFCPNLQSIDLSSLNVSSSGILALTANCSNITKLSLGSCSNSCDNDLLQLFTKNKELKYLKISSNCLTGKCLSYLPKDSIQEIILSECNMVSPCFFLNALKKFDNLHSLTLQTCVSFNDSVVQALRLRTNSLKNLELSGYFPMLSSQALKNLAELVNLEKLNLGQNISVTDDCLLVVSECCKQLKSIDINGCQAVTDNGIAGLVTLPKLEVLIISYLGKVTDQHLGNLQSLRILECRGCPDIKDMGLCTLAFMATKLELLDISGCNCVTNNWIDCAIRYTESRTNGIILKVFIGSSGIDVGSVKEVSPFLQLINVDLCIKHLRPDFDHYFFPEENDYDDSDYEDDFDNLSWSSNSSHEF
ncbi:F-box/LRR-repeat protein 2-like [Leptopilina heterotoma]|uniref:F-box/LRR-repeat protein 2-like n=1 Tax=Leptopilina heterotoma TaxID=63436 RepID=UPI001CA94FC7|nr:F-box/LRR-repeat protein 2-like [Leptopilina heterotoma]